MLILSRKPGESIVIDGRIHVKVVRIEGDVVKIGIEAPTDVQVHRNEVYEEILGNNQQAVRRQRVSLPKVASPTRRPAPAKSVQSASFDPRTSNPPKGNV